MYGYIKENLTELGAEISALAEARGGEVTLVCVTKSGTDEELSALLGYGAADIGENRPQELVRRGALLKELGYTPRLHEIGHLQRNKVKYIIEDVYLIHSLDTVELAAEIDRQAKRVGRRVPVLIEVNSAAESAKSGVLPKDVEQFYLDIKKFDSLIISGLMTMGPVCEDPEDIRPYFRLTKELFDFIRDKHGFEGEPVLSMGMSDSYAVAIQEGSTLVRVGRRLFQKKEI